MMTIFKGQIGFIGDTLGNIYYAKTNNIIDGTKSFPEFRQYMIDEFGLDEKIDLKSITYNNAQKNRIVLQ